jgi:hypothetical protein
MIFINGVAFEKVGSQIWIVSCTAPLHRTYTIVSAERQYLCSTYFDYTVLHFDIGNFGAYQIQDKRV